MEDKQKPFVLTVESKIYCLNVGCVNNVTVQHTCNLKGILISEDGECSGAVKTKNKKKHNK
jgi:hypothetical protein